jgi:beta-glucanase (GH16 family)
MKASSAFAVIAILALTFSSCAKHDTAKIVPCDISKHYALIWNEEFDYKGLPDTTKWGYEEGFIRNNESQYYAKSRLENARVEDGMLIIESRKEAFQSAQYTSASIFGKASFPVNSRVEVRAKLPSGEGIWPAIWMMGTDIIRVGWPRCGEIDIMEFLGRTPGVIYGTFHWWDAVKPDSNIHQMEGDTTLMADVNEQFHVYGVERTPNTLTFFVDNHYYFTFKPDSTVESNLLAHPYCLLLNTAVGGDWGGKVDDAIFPQKYWIDWIRVFEMKP